MLTRVTGGLTPDEEEASFDKVLDHEASLKLVPFANEREYEKWMGELFPDPEDRGRADLFLVQMQRRYYFAASKRQAELVDNMPDSTFETVTSPAFFVRVVFDDRQYDSETSCFCHDCRTPMPVYDSMPDGRHSCGNCGSINTTNLDSITERDYLSLLREYEKGPTAPSQPQDGLARDAMSRSTRF